MPYTVTFDEEKGIVHVTFSVSAVKDDHLAAFDEALRVCQEHACSKLLVNLSGLSASNLSTTESFAIGEAVAKNQRINLLIAHVLPTHVKARENVRFASTVEANRGRMTGVFDTVEQAQSWLLRTT